MSSPKSSVEISQQSRHFSPNKKPSTPVWLHSSRKESKISHLSRINWSTQATISLLLSSNVTKMFSHVGKHCVPLRKRANFVSSECKINSVKLKICIWHSPRRLQHSTRGSRMPRKILRIQFVATLLRKLKHCVKLMLSSKRAYRRLKLTLLLLRLSIIK